MLLLILDILAIFVYISFIGLNLFMVLFILSPDTSVREILLASPDKAEELLRILFKISATLALFILASIFEIM